MSKTLILSALLAFAEARFGQEGLASAAISALGDFGEPGQAATLSGQSPGVLLGGANACDKLVLADQIVATLGDDAAVIAAALGLVSAEKNFNNFAADIPTICADATLPVTVALRGVLALIDPGVLGSDLANDLVAQSLQNPFDNAGLSVAEIFIANGFSNFTAQDSAGGNVALAGLGEAAAADAGADDAAANVVACGGAAAAAADDAAADDAEADDAEADADADAAADGGAADFGACDPQILRAGGLGGRPADEFTFQSVDPQISSIQQEALNPNIITNRICDELVNQCGANQAALDLCDAAQAAVAAIGAPDDRSDATVDVFNTALGF